MHPRDSNNANRNKSSSIDKSGIADIALPSDDVLSVEAEHINVGKHKTIIWLSDRSDGIDIITTDREVIGRSDRGQELLEDARGDGPADGEDAHTDKHADGEKLVTDGGETLADQLFDSRIHDLPFLYASTMDGDTFIDKRPGSESDRATLREYDAPRGPGYDLIVGETGEVLVSGGELTAKTMWEALVCEACSEAFLFSTLDTAPESCPECGATGDCGEDNGGEE